MADEFQYIDDVAVSHHCRAKTFNPDTREFTGPRCKSWVKPGELVCRRHGGMSPTVKTKAEVRKAEINARAQFKKRHGGGVVPIEDIYAELEVNAAEAQAFKQICWERLEAIGDWRYSSSAGEQLRAEVALYERAMERANKFLIDYVRLGIADRRVKVAEAQAVILVGVIKAVLDRLELSREQKAIAARVVPEELRAISGPSEEA